VMAVALLFGGYGAVDAARARVRARVSEPRRELGSAA